MESHRIVCYCAFSLVHLVTYNILMGTFFFFLFQVCSCLIKNDMINSPEIVCNLEFNVAPRLKLKIPKMCDISRRIHIVPD